MQVMDPLWLLNPGQTSPEVQNSISDPTKWTDVLQKLKKEKCRTKIDWNPQHNVSNDHKKSVSDLYFQKVKSICYLSSDRKTISNCDRASPGPKVLRPTNSGGLNNCLFSMQYIRKRIRDIMFFLTPVSSTMADEQGNEKNPFLL